MLVRPAKARVHVPNGDKERMSIVRWYLKEAGSCLACSVIAWYSRMPFFANII